jgi:serine/threonine protein kinase
LHLHLNKFRRRRASLWITSQDNKSKVSELKERIAAGGFGAVYRAQQSTVGREVAVKVILLGLANPVQRRAMPA